jgi:hypothetical protein
VSDKLSRYMVALLATEPDRLIYPLSLIWLVLAGITSSNSSSLVRPTSRPLSLFSYRGSTGDAGVGKSSLLVRLTDQRFLANPDPTVRILSASDLVYSRLYNQAWRRVWLKANNYTRRRQQSCETTVCVLALTHTFLRVLCIPLLARVPPPRLVVRKETPSSDCITHTHKLTQAGTPPEPNPSAPSRGRTTVVPRAAYSSTM